MTRPRILVNPRYIWQQPDWPAWRFNATALAAPLALVHRAQGELMGRMAELGLAERERATLHPFFTPRALSAFAKRHTWSSSWR